MSNLRNQLKGAELLSLMGACIASAGIGAYLAALLGAIWLLLLVAGLSIHAVAMFYRHRLEQSGDQEQTPWERFLYRACWATILLLAVYLAVASLALP